MRRIVLALTLFCLLETKADNVMYFNGEKVEKDLATMTVDPEIPGNLLVHFTDNTTISYNMNLLEIRPNETNTSIAVAESNFFKVNNHVKNEINLEGIPVGTHVSIYSADGTLMYNGRTHSESYNADVSTLAKGTYILCIGRHSIKFVKD